MKKSVELRAAAAIVAAAVSADVVTGRSLAAFYAQTAGASWVGVAFSGVLFALATGFMSAQARRCGAVTVPELLMRLPGGGTGRGAVALYGVILVASACAMLSAAGKMGALMLPVRHAGILGMAMALLLAGALALSGKCGMQAAGAGFMLLTALFETALLLWGRAPEAPHMRYVLQLHLRNSWTAALLLGLVHTALCLCLSAGVTVRFSGGRVRPVWLGLWAGTYFAALLALGNGVLCAGEQELLALKLPFVALSGGWGAPGFYLNALLVFSAATTSLAGALYGVLPCTDR